MSKEKLLKVNVTFPLEVPVLTDSAGRRRSIPDQVAGYIDDFMSDIRITMECIKANRTDDFMISTGPTERDIEIFDKISSKETGERLAENDRRAEEQQIRFDKAKDKECRELYDMPWKEFRLLKHGEQIKIRNILGVVWIDGKFRKGDVKKNDEECLDLYGCSWFNFRMLTHLEQNQMRQKHNVIQKDGKWIKEEK